MSSTSSVMPKAEGEHLGVVRPPLPSPPPFPHPTGDPGIQ